MKKENTKRIEKTMIIVFLLLLLFAAIAGVNCRQEKAWAWTTSEVTLINEIGLYNGSDLYLFADLKTNLIDYSGLYYADKDTITFNLKKNRKNINLGRSFNLNYRFDLLDSAGNVHLSSDDISYSTKANDDIIDYHSFSSLSDGAYKIKFTWWDCTRTGSGSGTYSGNKTSSTFYVDTKSPSIAIKKGYILSGTNQTSGNSFFCASDNLIVSMSDDNWQTGRLNSTTISPNIGDTSYLYSSKPSEHTGIQEGTNYFSLTDKIGNNAYFYFVYDSTYPTLTSSDVSSGDYTVYSVGVTASDAWFSSCTYSLNGANQGDWVTASGSSKRVYDEGAYKITANDKAGNTSTFSFTIDKTAPSITGTTNNAYISADVTITVNDTNFSTCTYTLNGTAQGNVVTANGSKTFSADGKYVITATDKAGNSKTLTFTIDKTAPAFSVNSFYKAGQTVSITITETNLNTVTLDGTAQGSTRSWSSNNLSEGSHTIIATDKAGNSTTKTFTVDKTNPVITGYKKSGGAFVDNAKINELVYFTPTDATPVTYIFYRKSGSSYSQLSAWNNYQQKTIYFDRRELDYSAGLYSNDHIFYTQAEANAYIQGVEEARITKKTNWTTAVQGAIIESETPYSSTGADYWLYTTSTGNKYIFFAESRAKAYITNNLGNYRNSSSIYYFYEEGDFKVRVTDSAGNYTEKTFLVDFTAPTTSFIGTTNGYAKGEFSYQASDSLAGFSKIEYKKPGDSNWTTETSTSVTIAKAMGDGTYTFRAYDQAGNVTTVSTAILDTTKPAFSVNSFYKAGQTVSITITETNLNTVTLDGTAQGSTRSWSSNNLSEGSHTIIATDKAGNSTTKSFKVDKTAPAFSVNSYYKAGQTVSITITETNFDKATYDGKTLSVVSLSASIATNNLDDGSHSVVVTDKAGNSTTKTFIVDKTVPAFTLNAFYNETETVTLVITETNLDYVTFDDVTTTARSWNASGLEEGDHTIIVTDKAGNATEHSFVVDKTAPDFTVNAFYNASQNVILSITEINPDYVTLDGDEITDFTIAAVTLADGTHTVIAYDKAGHNTKKTFIVDTTAPSYSVNQYYKAGQTVSITITETNLDVVTLDGTDQAAVRRWNSNDLTNGIHTIVVTDKAGNYTQATFTVDKIDPAFTLNAFYNASETVTLVITEANLDTVKIDGDATEETTFAASDFNDGKHTVVVTDLAGNSTTKTFIVDKTLPSVAVNAFYKAGQTVDPSITEINFDYLTLTSGDTTVYTGARRTWSTSTDLNECTYILTVYDFAGNSNSATFTVDRTVPTFSVSAFYKAGQTVSVSITEVNIDVVSLDGTAQGAARNWETDDLTEGSHTIAVTDKAGNATEHSFVVDKTAPAFSVNSYYKAGQTISVSITETNLDVVTLDGTAQGSTRSWSSNNLSEGSHSIRATDKAGNYTEHSFVVDKTAPAFNLNAYYNASETVTLVITEVNLDSVTLDGTATTQREFAASELDDGSHTVVVTDLAGNSATVTFVVDKTAPQATVNEYYKAGQTVDPTITEINFDYLTLTTGDTMVYTGARRTWNTSTDLNECTYILTVYDLAGNSNSATFTVDRTAPTFTLNAFYNASETVTLVITETNLDYLTFDGETTDSTTFAVGTLTEGTHTVIAYDKAGNNTKKTFVVDKTAPAFSVNSYYKAGQTISVSITETNLDVVTLDGTAQGSTRSWSSNNLSEGSHSIRATDKAGNYTEHSFVVDKTAPAFNLNAYYNASETVTLVITEVNLDSVTLDGAATDQREFVASALEDGSHTVVATDKAGNSTTKTFTVDTVFPDFSVNSYYRAGQTIILSITEVNPNYVTIASIGTTTATQFSANDFEDGEYSITSVDLAGNSTTKSFIVDKTLPVFSVNAFYNASETVALAITEVNLNYVTLDGDVITNYNVPASELEDGTHTIIVYDLAGNERSKAFIVDKTAPVFTLKEFYAANETISLIVEEENLDYVTLDGVTVAARSWDGTTLSEGAHSITVYDKAKNSTTADFYFKTAQPVLSFRKNGASASSGVYLAAGDTIQVVISDDQFDHLTLDGVKVTDLTDLGNYQWTETWLSEDLTEGTHTFIVYDKAYNETSLVFSIDRTVPTLTFKVNGSVAQGYVYVGDKDNISFSYSDMNVDRCELDGEVTTTTQYSVAALTEYGHSFIVYDKAGNFAEVEFYVDKTAPTFNLNAFYNGGSDITLSIVETNLAYVTFDGDRLQGNVIATGDLIEGEHTVAAYDLAGNSATRSFVLDRTAPAFTLRSYYKASDVILVSVVESNPDRITLDGAVVSSTSWTGADLPDGEHTVAVYDLAGNVTERTFIVDTVSPILSVRKNGNVMQSGVFYAAHEDVVSVAVTEENPDVFMLDGVAMTQREFAASALEDGTHTVIVTDLAGNSATASFVVDKTAPTVTLRRNGTDVGNGSFYKESATVSAIVTDDNLDVVTLDGVSSEKNSWLASELYEGEHTFSACDRAGNVTSVTFVVDKTAPSIILNAYYGVGEEISVSDAADVNFAYATLSVGPAVMYTGGATSWQTDDLEECTYILTLYDLAGNSTTKSFIVDKTAPAFDINAYYNATQSVRIRVSEENFAYVTLDGDIVEQTNYPVSALEEGTHTIIAADLAGNTTTRTFIVDKTAPDFAVNAFYNASETVTLSITETNLDYVTLDGAATTQREFAASALDDGVHTVVATDKAGNSTTKSFTVDKTVPTFSVNAFYKAGQTVSITITETNLDVVTLDGTAQGSTRSWSSNNLSEGSHSIRATDKAGNYTEHSFVVDKTAPAFNLNAYYNASETVTLVITEVNLDSVTLDGVATTKREFAASELEDGPHTVVVTDLVGNSTTKSFIVDKTAPTFDLNPYYKASETVRIRVTDANISYVVLDDEVITNNNVQASTLDDGLHTVVAVDLAGNTMTKTFTVDKTAPVILVSKEYFRAEETAKIEITELNLDTVTLDGDVITNYNVPASELEDGAHTVIVTDLAGNSVTASFVVDKTAPEISVNAFYNASETIRLSIVERNLNYVTLDGVTIDSYNVAASTLSEGSHTIKAIDRAGNSATASFVVDKTAPDFAVNAFYNASETVTLTIIETNLDYVTFDGEATEIRSFSVTDLDEGTHTVIAYDKAKNNTRKTFIVDKTAPAFSVNAFYKAGQTVSVSITEVNLDVVTLDGTAQGAARSWKTDDLAEGDHTIIVTDKAGNSTEHSFIIDKTAPAFELNAYYNASETITLEIEEEHFSRMTLNGEETSDLNVKAEDLTERKYTVVVYDLAGNSTTKSFIVDKTAPTFSVNAFYNASETIRIRVTDVNPGYILLDDDVLENANVQASTLDDGLHTVVAVDLAGNTTTKSFIVDKTAPILYLADYYSSGKNVYLQPIEVNLDYVTLDGAVAERDVVLSDELEDGSHTVKVYDLAGNSATVTFIVDKTAPAFSVNAFYKASDTISLRIVEENLRFVELDGLTTDLTSWLCAGLSEGEHGIAVTDFAGNVTTKSFIIDKTYPVVTLKSGDALVDTSYFKAENDFRIDVDEEYLSVVTLNGAEIFDFDVVVSDLEDGKYTVIATDLAGNSVSLEFYVDKTAPFVTLRRNMNDIAPAGVYVSSFDTVSVVVEDVNVDRVLFDGVETVVYSWTGSSLSDGEHTVTAYDKAGNVTTVSFIVHKGAPEFTLQEYYIAGETVLLDVSEEALETVLLDGGETFLRSWLAEDLGEGSHTISATDKAGNNTTKTFIVDTLNPIVELNKNSKTAEGVVYAKATDIISITVSDDNLDYVLFDNEVTDKRSWECVLLDEKEHFIVVSDKARNKTTVSFIVDRTAPAFSIKEYYLTGETVFIDVTEENPDGVYLDDERIFVSTLSSNDLSERTYILTAYDKAGNTTTKSFTVDLLAPILSIDGKDLSGGACTITGNENSYGEVKISATDIAGYTIYTRLNDGNYVSRGADYTIAVKTENEGTWSVYAVDVNGYTSDVVTFTVDFTAPKVVVFDTDADEERKGYTNTAFSVSVDDVFPDQLFIRRESDVNFSLCSQSTIEATLANEGTYQFYAVDKNGLRSPVRSVTLDLGAPAFALAGLMTETSDKGYTNTTFTYTASDRHFAAICYKKAGGTDRFETTDTSLTIENTKENEGTWLIYAEDVFGQRSETYSVTLNFTFDFRNVENIRNSFKLDTWYTVTLPSRIYSATSRPDIAGTYTFAKYDDALAFAVAKEKEYRVYAVTEGGYGYVSVNNENVYVTYPTESELEAAVLHYAIKYVSERKIFNKTEARNVYENITNAGFESDVTALTLNRIETPDFLSEYGLPVYFARQSFVPANNAALSPSSVKLTYVGNLTGAVEPYAFDLAYGESFSAALSRASNLYEGYYLYEESDLCGNKQSAILFIDLSEPTLKAHIKRGDSVEDLTVNKDAVGDRSGVFYAVSFSISELFDNADAENLCVNVVSDKYAGTFTATDELPVLDADFGAGTYSITVYDRSYNFLTFSVVIAGTAPSWSYTSLAANTKKLTVYINKNDRNNALLTLRLVKIRSDGTYIDLTEDSEGTVVSPANGTYVLTDGGKYATIMTDMYGRTIETDPIFYEKGLPSASFDGVRNGGVTNTNVNITYADMYGLKLFYDDGHHTPVNGLQPAYNAEKKTFTVAVEKTPDQTIHYLVFVYLLADEGVYIEYTFTIDCEAPTYMIEATDASPIGANGSTNKPFFVSWLEEGVTAKTQRAGYNAQAYQSGTILSLNTLYAFELSDKVGNVTRFTVYLDSEVLFNLSADVTIREDDYVLTRNKQKITIGEDYASFRLIDREGKEYAEGEELQNDGFYRLIVTDLYENVLDLEIEIDLTAPVLTLENVKENGLSNQDVTVTCAENAVVIERMTSRGSSDGEIKSGTVFSDEGNYSVRVTDRAGNSTKYDFVIDKTIRYACTAENGLFTTAAVSFTFSENVAQKVTIDGEEAESSLRYTVPGAYVVVITDDAGNEETVSFVILNERQQKLVVEDTKDFFVSKITHNGEDVESAAKSITLTESGKYEVTLSSSKTDKSYYFAVEIDNTAPEIVLTQKNGKVSFSGLSEKGVTFALYKDGELVEGITDKSTVSEKGNYVLVLTDECGNVTQYEFEVKFTLNAISIALIALGAAVVVLLIVLFIKGHRIKAA